MKKTVLKLNLHDDKTKKKAMKAACLSGVDSITMDMNGQSLTVTGNTDPVSLAKNLRKLCNTEMVSVGPAKEEKKDSKDEVIDYMKAYPYQAYYNPPDMTHYYYVRSAEEDPNACVIF